MHTEPLPAAYIHEETLYISGKAGFSRVEDDFSNVEVDFSRTKVGFIRMEDGYSDLLLSATDVSTACGSGRVSDAAKNPPATAGGTDMTLAAMVVSN